MPTKDEMNKFSKEVEKFANESGLNHLDAIVEYCEVIGLEIEVAATLVNNNLRDKLESDAMNQNLLKVKASKLPI